MIKPPQKLIDLNLWHGEVTVKPLTGGRSNEAYIASDDRGQYVVRFCHDIPVHHVNRDYEAMVSKASADAGFSPQLRHYAMNEKAEGVMVFQFIIADTYDKDDVLKNLQPVVKTLRAFHHDITDKIYGPGRLFNVFHVISDYIKTLTNGKAPHREQLADYQNISDQLKAVQIPEHIIFGHNDLVPQNILENDQQIWLIDFEYAAFSTPLSDLANLASNAMLTPEQDTELLHLYYNAAPSDEQIKALSALKCALMLREAMWSMVSEIHLNVPGVDYQLYTRECLEALQNELDTYQKSFGKFT